MNTRLAILVVTLAAIGCAKKPPATGESASPPQSRLQWSTISENLLSAELPQRSSQDGPRFASIPVEKSGLDFADNWSPPADYQLEIYNSLPGGGVCIGDFDGDDLPDVFLTQPNVGSRLYRNLGNLRFKDCTTQAGIGELPKAMGASFIDIDGDADLDLYVCNRDAPNALYVNLGDGRFEERAKQHGLDFDGASVMAAFADYDRDGDLDAFLVTYRTEPEHEIPAPVADSDGKFEIPEAHREFVDVIVDKDGRGRVIKAAQRDRLLRNDGTGHFEDVTDAAGITGNYWGLSANWWDYDRDGDLDLYVAHDFYSPDQLYRNRGDGTFEDVAPEALPHTPWYSMGSDVADINNDGWLDLMGSDMSGSNHYKQKASMGDMSTNAWFLVHGEPRQVMRNALYLNSGTGRFMEIAQMAGVANTDWTWSLKFADLDEDGWSDLFITNGMNRDWTNSDTRNRADAAKSVAERQRIWAESPPRNDKNLALRNTGGTRFEMADNWGLGEELVSYGAAFGDLDRDGDLDLVVNHSERAPGLYQNRSHQTSRVMVRLEGQKNHWGIGATIELSAGGITQTRTLSSNQGYMAANEPVAHFGIGKTETIDSLTVRWPNGEIQSFENLAPDRFYRVRENGNAATPPLKQPTMFEEIDALAGVRHEEVPFNDFARQPLLPHQLSQLGPGLTGGDIDGDGRQDVFMGGASGQSGQLMLNRGGRFIAADEGPWAADAQCEDMGALLFDADGDGDSDLYVVSGGIECLPGDEILRDRLYLNDGTGTFSKAELPDLRDSGSRVTAADFDKDGDLDLFVGSRVIPGQFPVSTPSRLLRNDGGTFVQIGAGMDLGMVTDAVWSDADGDGWIDLLVTTELGPVHYLRNTDGKLTPQEGLGERTGWFYSIAAADIDQDGDDDYLIGNLGRNTKYHPTPEKPYLLYYGDFDESGKQRLVEAKFEGDTLFPMRGKSCSTNAMPHLGEKFSTFHTFASASLGEIYGQQPLSQSVERSANTTDSGVLINNGEGSFDFQSFPALAQSFPTFAIETVHADDDQHIDIVLGGNFFGPQAETGRFDGGIGLLLRNNGKGAFSAVPAHQSGVVLPGDVKGSTATDLTGDGKPELIFANNDGALQTFRIRTPQKTSAIRAEFEAIGDSLINSNNPYLGRQQLATQLQQIKTSTTASPARINRGLGLCWTQLRLGKIADASATIEQAFADVTTIGGQPSPSMHKLRALVYLREAEYRNCIERHNPQCCVFPLAGDGVHSIKQPATKARESLLAMLRSNPSDGEARWLLNLSAMATGSYPDSVPDTFRFTDGALSRAKSPSTFVDVAGKLGVDTFNLCGGVAVEDFSGDGRLDIITSTYDPHGALTYYRRRANGGYDDASEASGLSMQLGGLNLISADYDNDGDADLLVLRGAWLKDQGQIRNSLLRNDGGKFTDVTESAGLAAPARPTQAAAWADFDNDGHLDLFIGNESRKDSDTSGGNFPSQLFRSNGDGTFTDIAPSAGVTNDRYCKGVAAGDIDNDGLVDLYVSNQGINRLYRNLGNLKFEDVAPERGMTEPAKGSFATWFYDHDNDGWLDLFVASYQSSNADVANSTIGLPHAGTPPCLYRNTGGGQFENIAAATGLSGAYLPMGANFGDIDNDGFLDIYLTTGRPDFAALMPNVMLRNRAGEAYDDITSSAGLGHLQKGHGIAFADLDDDGDQDIYHQLGGFYPGDAFHNTLFENRPNGAKYENRYLKLQLIGTACHRAAIGARIKVTVNTPSGTRNIHRAAGFVSSFGGSPSRLEIGLGQATSITRLEINWPGPSETVSRSIFEGAPLDSTIIVEQGKAEFRRL